MKQKQKYLLPLITPLLIGAAVQAGVITNYYDGFEGTGNGANLNTRPAPEGTLTANWFSRAAIKTTGSAVTITDGAGDNPSNASLGFTAEAGKIYALSASRNPGIHRRSAPAERLLYTARIRSTFSHRN